MLARLDFVVVALQGRACTVMGRGLVFALICLPFSDA